VYSQRTYTPTSLFEIPRTRRCPRIILLRKRGPRLETCFCREATVSKNFEPPREQTNTEPKE